MLRQVVANEASHWDCEGVNRFASFLLLGYRSSMTTFDPQAWSPPTAPKLTGAYESNDRLARATLLGVSGSGPEDVAIDASERIFTGLDNGAILELDLSRNIRFVADVGGRPLGIELYGEDDRLVCNADIGLQRVSKQGAVDTLLDSVDGERLTLTNNASVSSTGTVYFTESSRRWRLGEYESDLVEGRPSGRLLQMEETGGVKVLVDGLQFANGVALDADESSVFVAETGRYRIHRHWLNGDTAGSTEVFLDNLPGFPDNLSFADGILWVAFASPRQAALDAMASRTWMRKVAHLMPDALSPKPVRHGMVFGYGTDGTLRHNLQDNTGRVAVTTGVRARGDTLYIGMLHDSNIAVFEL